MPERVVCNTSPLLYLHQVDHLHILERLYGEIVVPPAVHTELQAGAQAGVAVPDLDRLPWVRIEPLPDRTLIPAVVDLGDGEAEAIGLALFYPGSLLILDDALGRRIARLSHVTCTGTLGVLLKAKQRGFLTQVRPVVEALRQTTMWLGSEIVTLVLGEAGETEPPG